MRKLLVLDVGGTAVKYGLADETGVLMPESVRQTPSHADEDAEAFLNTVRGIISECGGRDAIAACCVSMPGPFDFDRGVSLMQHKFTALYQKSLRPPFDESGIPVSFLHDSTAFLLGEYQDGSLRGAENACCVMLGTGLGFAWVKDGLVQVNDRQIPCLSLWNTPYLDGIAEDYVSTRALQRDYGESIPIRDMALKARSGDERALNAFRMAGVHLSALMNQVIEKLGCDRFALGGQISRAVDLFSLSLPIPWSVTEHPEDAALRGACRYAMHGRDKCVQIRESITL